MPITQPAEATRIPGRTIRSRRAITLTAAIASTALLAVGCGAASPGGSTSGANAGPPKDFASAAFRYSSCVRQHGVPDFPDPKVVNQAGHQAVILHVGPSALASPKLKAAQKACQAILPPPGTGNVRAGESPQQIAARVRGLVGFATCMRSHGITGFPDPTGQGKFSLAMVIAAGIDLQAPSVQAAARSCVPASDGQVTAADVARALHSGG